MDYEQLTRLKAIALSKPTSAVEMCDLLDCSPKRLRALIAMAKVDGFEVHCEHDSVGVLRQQPTTRQTIDISPITGDIYRIGALSDLHIGAKDCLHSQLNDCVDILYDRGVRTILGCGDIMQGHDPKWQWDCEAIGLEDQSDMAAERLPQRPGLRWKWITGNHDEKYHDKTGVNVGRAIESAFRDAGRDDLEIIGRCAARVTIGGLRFHLWHPLGSGAITPAYPLLRQVESYVGGDKPHVLLVGHWHKAMHMTERAIDAFALPCFLGQGSIFSKRLRGQPAIGGLLLEWQLAENGTPRRLASEWIRYYELETFEQVDPDLI